MAASKTEWFKPNITPLVPMGTESPFWIATKRTHADGVVVLDVRLAQYQNRPLELDEDGEPTSDDHLVGVDGDAIESIGWVVDNEHYEFENYYSPIEFNGSYELVAWAYVHAPAFPHTFLGSN